MYPLKRPNKNQSETGTGQRERKIVRLYDFLFVNGGKTKPAQSTQERITYILVHYGVKRV